MKNYLSGLMIFIFPIISMADTINCNGDCPKTQCSEIENFALVNLDLKARAFFDKFSSFNGTNATAKKAEAEINSMKKELQEIAKDRTLFGINCLKNYCAKSENKTLIKTLSQKLTIESTNPACDFSADNPNSPLTMNYATLKGPKGKILDIMFSVNGPLYSFNQSVLTKKCSDGVGGTFRNKIIASTNGISVVPYEGTTSVQNTPVGAQLVRTKKVIPYFQSLPNGNLQINYGDNFSAEIDITENSLVKENILREPCVGTIFKNPNKGTSRVVLPVQSINANGNKVFDTNNYKVIEAESNKLKW